TGLHRADHPAAGAGAGTARQRARAAQFDPRHLKQRRPGALASARPSETALDPGCPERGGVQDPALLPSLT
ncbi:hypothetical protein B8W90_14240, partial [Staphylococcus hominis]